jgi:predicted nucleic acid-binding protein
MIFVDSNVPMYLVGASHPHKSEHPISRTGCLERILCLFAQDLGRKELRD